MEEMDTILNDRLKDAQNELEKLEHQAFIRAGEVADAFKKLEGEHKVDLEKEQEKIDEVKKEMDGIREERDSLFEAKFKIEETLDVKQAAIE